MIPCVTNFKITLRNIYLNRQVLWRMAVSELKVKYSGSTLGIFWAVINPLLMMAAITFVFTTVIKLGIKHFALFSLAGIFPWMFFSGALFEATFSIIGHQSAMRQFNLPRAVIPLASVLSNFLNFLIGWAVVYPIFLLFNQRIIILLPFLIVVMILHFIFICGLSMVVSIMNVFFRDLGHLLEVLMMFWFWITPVFYPIAMIPGQFRWVFDINPMTYYVVSYRAVVFGGHIPPLSILVVCFLWCVVSLTAGLLMFSCFEGKILKEL